MILLTSLLVLLSLTLIYYFHSSCRRKLNYWNERNVPNLGPKTPMGDLLACVTRFKSVYDLIKDDIYGNFKALGHKYAGFYFTTGPVFVPIDFELIKRILVTDFDYFSERGMHHDKSDIPLSDNMFCSTRPRWKYLKDKLSATISPNKLKNVVSIVDHYVKDYCDALDAGLGKPVDIFKLTQRYTLDIACNFFLGVHETHTKGNESPLIEFAQQLSSCTVSNLVKASFKYGTSNPGVIFTSLIINKGLYNFLHDYTLKAYKLRKASKAPEERKDALNDLIETYEDENEDFDFQSFVGQVFVLLGGTYETTSTTFTYLMYELGKSEDYQKRLKSEIEDVLRKNNGNITYEAINGMEFLDRLVNETLRCHPLFALVNRSCVKDYKVPGSDLVIEKGTSVVVPIFAVHHDPDLFENPHRFDPDRVLSTEAKQAFIPFSMGLMQCPGKRVAMIVIKTLVIEVMRNYDVKVNAKTGPKLEKVVFTKHIFLKYKNTIWLEFRKSLL